MVWMASLRGDHAAGLFGPSISCERRFYSGNSEAGP